VQDACETVRRSWATQDWGTGHQWAAEAHIPLGFPARRGGEDGNNGSSAAEITPFFIIRVDLAIERIGGPYRAI
jgi:hypothetical protein